MDLRLDIERRKKYSTHERYYNEDQGRDAGDSPDSSRERSVENFHKYHKKSKKSKKKKKRSRSTSSSSSSSSKSNKDEGLPQEKPDSKNGDFNKNQLGQRESSGSAESGHPHGGFQVRIRGRNWSKGNYQGNISHSNPVSMVVHQKSEDWNPEYTPKSKKYYLHDDRDEESESKWTDNRGRGRGSLTRGRARFLIRKATGGPNIIYPKWGLDKFQVNDEQGGMQREETEQDHKRAEVDGENI